MKQSYDEAFFHRLAVFALFSGLFLPATVEGRTTPRNEAEISVSGGITTIAIRHNLGCKAQSTVTLSPKQLLDISRLFQTTAKTPRIERRQIRGAITLFKRIAGLSVLPGNRRRFIVTRGVIPTALRPLSQPRNQVRTTPLSLIPPRHYGSIEGQMDCVDESRNTTRFLEQRGLLAWHRVLDDAFRTPRLFEPHWGAQIEETVSGERFAVDS